MTLFNFSLQRGTPIVEQVVFASIRAILRGEYRAGQPFPSVRVIASNLKIHPNTTHKAIQALIADRWLEAQIGVGTVVAARPKSRSGNRDSVRAEIERLAIKAGMNELSLSDVTDELRNRWKQLNPLGRVE